MFGPEGQRRALHGLMGSDGDVVVLLHAGSILCEWPIDRSYPCLNDKDQGNPGRGALVATWRATLPASMILGNVAEEVQVKASNGAIVLSEKFPHPIRKDPGKELLVYANEHVR